MTTQEVANRLVSLCREGKHEQVVKECAAGLENLPTGLNKSDFDNFEEFILKSFGPGISEHFMLPYNRKLWGRDLKRMAADWTSERSRQPTDALKRHLHTLKGGARMAGITAMGDLSHEIETLLISLDDGRVNATSAVDEWRCAPCAKVA